MSYEGIYLRKLRTSVDVPFGVFTSACKAETLIDASAWTLLIDTRARRSLHEHPRPRAHSLKRDVFPELKTRLTVK